MKDHHHHHQQQPYINQIINSYIYENEYLNAEDGSIIPGSSLGSDVFQDEIHYLSPASSATSKSSYEVGRYGGKMSAPTASIASCAESNVQRTICIVKPRAMLYKDVVEQRIREIGLDIVAIRTLRLTPEQVAELYSQYYGSTIFPHLVVSMSCVPVLVMAVAGINAISRLQSLIEPDGCLKQEWFCPLNIRLRHGLVQTILETIHAAGNTHDANRENRFFYAENVLDPVLAEENTISDYFNLHLRLTMNRGLVELLRNRPLEPLVFLGEWLLANNPNQPKLPEPIARLPT